MLVQAVRITQQLCDVKQLREAGMRLRKGLYGLEESLAAVLVACRSRQQV